VSVIKHQLKPWCVSPTRSIALEEPVLIAVLNVTPDSFSDGGAYPTASRAVEAALRMIEEGASIIDIGGESTRPGAAPVRASEQIARTMPVIRALRARVSASEALLSIDTTRSVVAAAALDSGADIINDVSAGRDDEAMLPLAAGRQCGLILMHRRLTPGHDVLSHQYAEAPDYSGDVCGVVRAFLLERAMAAIKAGVHRDAIVIDPGFGFGKSVQQNLELASVLGELQREGFAVLSAVSRKSFVGTISGVEQPSQRVAGTLAFSVLHAAQGVRLFRVHDVAVHRQGLAVAGAMARAMTQTAGR